METPAARDMPSVFISYDEPPVGDSEYNATHDSLTGLLNNTGLEIALDYVETTIPGNFAVIEFDLDKLKSTNDTHGHAAGDRLLQDTAAGIGVIKGAIRTNSDKESDSNRREQNHDLPDVVAARKSGDEFWVILPGINEQETAELVEQRIQKNLKEAGVDASSGSATHEQGIAASELLELADAKMYLDKSRREQAVFDELPLSQKLLSSFGDMLIRLAGDVRPPKG